jgi:hypothetical protein
MKYILKDWKQNGSVQDTGNGKSKLSIMIWTCVEGDKYGFERTDATVVTFSNSLDVDEVKESITSQAAAFVANKYK